jgi:hypothetical protein
MFLLWTNASLLFLPFPPCLISRPAFLVFLQSLVTTQYPLLIWLVFFSPYVLIGCLEYDAGRI